ncbi:MAG: putative ABC transporter permease [Treponema sp.]|jgi:uncharacterized membrane protein|nr:putative ABC transporter permease [Treponema sp.]
MLGLSIEQIIFLFFFFSASGWIGESIMESIVRKRFVSKGVFKGPYVPVHGVGAIIVYAICNPIRQYPLLVFLACTAVCTLVEYLAAIILEKIFSIRGWDYETYPFTKWCHYKRRIALTTSLFFGLVGLGVIYLFWDLGMWLISLFSQRLLVVIDIILCAIFLFDVVFTGVKYISNRMAGIPNKTIGLK